MTGFPLRRYGPRVFISYSFRDASLAESIHISLTAQGFQVSREDETSLINQRLTEAIPRRIAEAEVLIQLRTATSNLSEWVAREFSYALDLKSEGQSIVILPIVFDKSTLPNAVKEWWFMDLEGSGLTAAAVAQIERICLSSVHLLALSEDDPLSLVEDDLLKLLRGVPDDGKRVIVDSDGKLLSWAQDTLDYFEESDSRYRDQLVAQEKGRFDKLVRHYKIVDEVVRKLAIEAMRVLTGYTNEPSRRALVPLSRFVRIVLGDDVITAAEMAPPATHPLRTKFKNRIDTARESNTENHSRGYLNPGFYAWVFNVQGGEESMSYMGLRAPGFRDIPIQIPASVFGSMADIYTRTPISFSPTGELLTGDFVDYVLPQIAVHAAYNLTDDSTVRNDLEKIYAWRLEQYSSMGLN